MTRCDCCDLPVESCGRAAERRQAEARRARADNLLRTYPGARPAAFPGLCRACGEPIRRGEPIALVLGHWTALLCCGAP